MRFQAQRGTEDVLPTEAYKWVRLETIWRETVRRYGYSEIRTPTFEDTELFVRTSGETSDIVTKQMYQFQDKGGRDVTLKPEGTAPAMRSVLEHNLSPQGQITRLAYVTPIFRYERPQKGRLREAHQVGLELMGSTSPLADAEVIEVTIRFFQALGIPDPVVLLNSIGRDECRSAYRQAILDHAKPFLEAQTAEYRERVEMNPLRLLDSKDPEAQEALKGLPPILDYLEPDSASSFAHLQALLAEAGIDFEVRPEIVRGLDYYTDTVFEVQSSKLGSQSSLCGGGRYDNLVKDLGGPATPSVGVGIGIERTLLVLDAINGHGPVPSLDAFIVQGTPEAAPACRRLLRQLREAGLAATSDLDCRSMKSQFRQADKSGARFALVIGDDELAKGVVQVKNLKASSQTEVPWDEVASSLKEPE